VRKEAEAHLRKATARRRKQLDADARAALERRVRALLDSKTPEKRAEFAAGAAGAQAGSGSCRPTRGAWSRA